MKLREAGAARSECSDERGIILTLGSSMQQACFMRACVFNVRFLRIEYLLRRESYWRIYKCAVHCICVLATEAVEALDLKFEISDLTWLQVLRVGSHSGGLFRASTIESVGRHDFFGIAIGIVIEAPLSGHMVWDDTGPYGLSTTRKYQSALSITISIPIAISKTNIFGC
jgi:hypothetical protein